MNRERRKTITEVVQAVFPVLTLIAVLKLTLIPLPMQMFIRFLIGAILVAAGLIFFLKGVRSGLLPIGEAIGSELPKRASVIFLLFFAFILGFAITVAEPDVRVLAYQVDFVSGGEMNKALLILVVSLSVGISVSLAMLRIILGIPIAYIFAGGYLIVLVLSFFTPSTFFPVAFDAGGVTTGPVTVPFILALGLGLVSVLGGKSSLSDGFGIVGIASIGPIIGVMILGIIYG